MPVDYDKYYQADDLFGEPYPELLEYFARRSSKGKVLDIGCGQGRDALAIARMGYEVTGMDHSKVGLKQMSEKAAKEQLSITATEADIYAYPHWDQYEILLLNSFFHFGKREKQKETALLIDIIKAIKKEAELIICIQRIGKKVEQLTTIISEVDLTERIKTIDLEYQFVDQASNHSSITPYQIIIEKKK